MQQKLAIAIALLHDPEILLLDEPTLGLGVQAKRLLEDKIAELARQGKAIVLTTHSMELAEKLSSNILVINNGQRIAYGPKNSLIAQYNTKAVVEVEVEAQLSDPIQSQLFEQFQARITSENGRTLLVCLEPEQRHVLQLLDFLDRNQHTVTKVVRREADLEEVFINLISRDPQ
jgi:ABC-2 type transport system ATP-binding protein